MNDADEKKIIANLKATKPRSYAVYMLGGAVQWTGSYIAASCRKAASRKIGLILLSHLGTALQQVQDGENCKATVQEATGLLTALKDEFAKQSDHEMAHVLGVVVDQLNEAAESAERATS